VSGYTIVNLKDVEDRAAEGGPRLEARIARNAMESEHLGVRYVRWGPGRRSGSVVINPGGAGVAGGQYGLQARQVVSAAVIRQWDVVRVAPATFRGFAAGPDGLELLAIGSDRPEGGDGVSSEDRWWGDEAP
jgi:hypothetical protein